MNKFVCDCGKTTEYFSVGKCKGCYSRHCMDCHQHYSARFGTKNNALVKCNKCTDHSDQIRSKKCAICIGEFTPENPLFIVCPNCRGKMSTMTIESEPPSRKHFAEICKLKRQIDVLQHANELLLEKLDNEKLDNGSDSDSDSDCVHEDELPSRITIVLKEAYTPGDCVIETDDGEYDVLADGTIIKRKYMIIILLHYSIIK